MDQWFRAAEYLQYLLKARTIHSVHSPFVFDFVQHVLLDKRSFYCYEEIESLREKLLARETPVRITDFGAGSMADARPVRTISSLARNSATPARFSQLLFRICLHYDCKCMLELGSSLGLTTLYLSSVSESAKVVTLEGDPALATLAQYHFSALKRKNISLLTGTFESRLPSALDELKQVDLAYVDGNHRKEATIGYVNQLLPFMNEKSILVIGDIHWSREMNEAWKTVIASPQVTVTIDLFYLGIIFFRKELSRQEFVIRW